MYILGCPLFINDQLILGFAWFISTLFIIELHTSKNRCRCFIYGLIIFISLMVFFKFPAGAAGRLWFLYHNNCTTYKDIDISSLNGEHINLNILTRSGNRKNCYLKLKNSLEKQTHRRYRHILTIDNDECDFIQDVSDRDIVRTKRVQKNSFKFCNYNAYFNSAIATSDPDAWLLFFDDDLRINDNRCLERIAKICSITPRCRFLTIGKNITDTACICVHRSVAIKHKWTTNCYGDVEYIHRLLKAGVKRDIYNKIDSGFVVNGYDGASNGSSGVSCGDSFN